MTLCGGLFIPLPASSCQMHSAFSCPLVCDYMLNVCEHDILQTACEYFAEFTT